MEKFEVFDRVGSCKENVRRNGRYLIELRAVKEFVSTGNVSYRVGVVRRMLGEMIGI